MAIVDMKKLSVIALSEEKTGLVEELMSMGVAQIEDIDPESMDEKLGSILTKSKDDDKLSEYDASLKLIKEAIDILSPYSTAKKAMFAPKVSVSAKMFDEIKANVDGELDFAKEVCDLKKRGGEIKAEQNRASNEIAALSKWKDLPFALDYTGTKYTGVLLGVLPSGKTVEMVDEVFEENALAAHCEAVNTGSDGTYVYILYHRACEQEMMSDLSKVGFSASSVSGEGKPSDIIDGLEKKIATLDDEKENSVNTLRKMAENKLRLEALYDYISECMEKEMTYAKLAGTAYTVMVSGWVPAETADKVLETLDKKFCCVADAADPGEDEDYPILLRNPSIVQPFESVTEMYSLPAPHSMDPNKLMAPFYALLFGMMVSDAGYGLVLTLATWFILWKFKPQGQAGKLIKLICFGGIATIFWGIIFGGYFGDTVQVVYKLATGNTLEIPYLLNPSADPISVLILSLVVGLIHLFAGMGAKAYLLIKRGKVWDAIFDIGFWYLVLGGLGIFAFGIMLPGTPVGDIGMWTAIVGVVGLICTQGREKPSIIGKLVGGIGSLYDIVSYLSDLLSYSRLLALGLSTGVVASVVNVMGAMGGNSVGGWILFAAVFLIGHTFNLAINTLGAYVHSSRLQYVEFFGKFYESGGKAFNPLKRPRKYVEVVDSTEN